MITKLVIDARMIMHSGIGRVIRNILFAEDFSANLNIKSVEVILPKGIESDIEGQFPDDWKLTYSSIGIYSIQEQFAFREYRKQSNLLWWSPHYNVPIFGSSLLLVTVHDLIHVARPDFFPKLKERIYANLMFRALLNKASEIIFVSDFSKTEMERLFDVKGASLNVIENDIDDLFLSAIDQVQDEDRTKNYMLYVGNVKPHKNIKALLNAFVRAKDKLSCDLYIVGEREGFRNAEVGLDELIDECEERVVFTGRVSDDELITYYREAKFMVFPSHYEGFGLPPVESMCLGCPVLASDIPAVREICKDAVSYFDPYSVEDIQAKIEEFDMNKELRMRFKQRSYKRVNDFKVKKAASQYAALINQITS